MIGRLTDGRGPVLPLCVGLLTATPLLLVLPLPESVLALAVLSVITLGGPLTAYTIPAMAVITDSAERLGITLVLSSMLFNIACAIGEMIGAPAAASISQAISDAVPLASLAAVMLARFACVVTIGLGPAAEATETKPIPLAAESAARRA
jgi:hypothetical protein